MTQETFDENNIPPVENESTQENSSNKESSIENGPVIAKEAVVGVLKTNGLNPESIDLLQKFTEQVEEKLIREGREDARIESLREKGHALNLAGLYLDAIYVMEDVAQIAYNENDNESHREALWIIERLNFLNDKKQEEDRKKESAIKQTKAKLEAITSPKISKEEVLGAYKNLSQKTDDPHRLNRNDPEVESANMMHTKWVNQKEIEGETDENIRLRNNFEVTMFYVDAGFTGKNYLEEVLSLLYTDAFDVEKDPNDLEKVALRGDIAKAMLRIRALLKL